MIISRITSERRSKMITLKSWPIQAEAFGLGRSTDNQVALPNQFSVEPFNSNTLFMAFTPPYNQNNQIQNFLY